MALTRGTSAAQGSLLLALAASLICAAGPASPPAAARPCPEHKLGITEEKGTGEISWRFLATAEATSFTGPSSPDRSAPEDARIAASTLLLATPEVRRHMEGDRLRGAYPVAECWVGNQVFVTIAVDSTSLAMAIALRRQIQGDHATDDSSVQPDQGEARLGFGPQERSEMDRLLELPPH